MAAALESLEQSDSKLAQVNAAIIVARDRSRRWRADKRHLALSREATTITQTGSPVNATIDRALLEAARRASTEEEHRGFRLQLAAYLDGLWLGLSKDWRAAVELHLDGWHDREIARAQGCSAASVRHLRAKGLKRCRELAKVAPPST
jgi:DNA-directed RNA polymerase specialized sigma24 family protein